MSAICVISKYLYLEWEMVWLLNFVISFVLQEVSPLLWPSSSLPKTSSHNFKTTMRQRVAQETEECRGRRKSKEGKQPSSDEYRGRSKGKEKGEQREVA